MRKLKIESQTQKPITTTEAMEECRCTGCKEGRECNYSAFEIDNCVELGTCSTMCTACDARIWFSGSWGDKSVPTRFACPVCGKTNHDTFLDYEK